MTPIKYHGGKHYIAKRVVELTPRHLTYVEPFFGGGQVLFARDPDRDWYGDGLKAHERGSSEVVNDINRDLTTFWRVLQSEELFAEFQRRIAATPMSEIEFDQATLVGGSTPVERAVAFFVQYRQSRQGLGKDFATMSQNRTRRRMNEQASSYWSAIDGLDEAHERLKRVVIFNRDACDVIRQQDSAKTFVYADPPYLTETRVARDAYAHEMTDDQHRELLDTLAEMEGAFILSGYPNRLYDEVAKRWGWNRIDIKIDNKASSRKTKEKKTEVLWFNFEGAE